MPSAAARSLNPFRVLATHRSFRIFWIGQTLSLIGTWMQQMALGWLALELSDSAFLVGLVRSIGAWPIVLFSFVAGAVADRRDRLRLVFLMQALMLVEAGLLFWFTWTGHVTIPVLVGLAAAHGLFSAFEIPARQAMMIDLVGREDLHGAIALNSSGFNLARIVGPALGAGVIRAFGIAWCFGLNAVSYLFVLLGLLRLDRRSFLGGGGDAAAARARRSDAPGGGLRQVLREVGDGLRYIRRTRPVNELMRLVVVFSVCGIPYLALMPVVARDILGLGASGYGVLLAFVGVGGLAGALLLAALGQRVSRARLLRASAFAFPLLLILLAVTRSPVLARAVLLATGAVMILNGALANGILQSIVDDAFRGRLMAVYSFVVVGLSDVVGSFAAGLVARSVGADWAIGGAAALMLAYTTWAYARGGELQRL